MKIIEIQIFGITDGMAKVHWSILNLTNLFVETRQTNVNWNVLYLIESIKLFIKALLSELTLRWLS